MQALFDPLVTRASPSIIKAYKKYLDPTRAPPVMAKFINESKGYGIFSIEKIPTFTLICEYAADILPVNYFSKNDKSMYFGWGSFSYM
jgi:hypothetical protein